MGEMPCRLSQETGGNFKKKNELVATSHANKSAPSTHPRTTKLIISMSPTGEPVRRMSTRGGARDKMAKVLERIRTGGIVEETAQTEQGGGGDGAVTDNDGENAEDTPQSSTRRNAKAKRAKKVTKKAHSTKKASATKKANAKKEADAAAIKALGPKLAALEDAFLKKDETTRTSHPRHWAGNVPGKLPTLFSSTGMLICSTGQGVAPAEVGEVGRPDESNAESETSDGQGNKGKRNHQPATKNASDDGEHHRVERSTSTSN
jgi:hypothetical protein